MTGAHHHARTAVLVILLLAGHLAAAPMDDEAAPPAQPMIGERAPAFDLKTVQGGRLSLEELAGEFVVIHFGTSW